MWTWIILMSHSWFSRSDRLPWIEETRSREQKRKLSSWMLNYKRKWFIFNKWRQKKMMKNMFKDINKKRLHSHGCGKSSQFYMSKQSEVKIRVGKKIRKTYTAFYRMEIIFNLDSPSTKVHRKGDYIYAIKGDTPLFLEILDVEKGLGSMVEEVLPFRLIQLVRSFDINSCYTKI